MRMFKWLGIGFLAFVLLVAAMAFLGLEKTRSQTIQAIDLQQAPDGMFEGAYYGYRFTNVVEVTVKDHAIIDIHVKKTQRTELSETLKIEVIKEQSPVIDAVSGASLDQTAFLKAVEDALLIATASTPD